jgi:hypothetical protein
MAEQAKRAPKDGNGTDYSSPNDRNKKISRTDHLLNNPYTKGTQIEEEQEKRDDPSILPPTADDGDTRILGKVLLELFVQANIWFTINPEDTSVIIIEAPTSIPAPSTLLDRKYKPRWELIAAIPNMDPFLPEELQSKGTRQLKLDQVITRHLVRMNLPKTGFQAKLSTWLINNLASYKTKKILPVFSLANRLARTPFPGFDERDKSYILSISPVVEFWIAAIDVFGSAYLPKHSNKSIYSKANDPIHITPLDNIYTKHSSQNVDTRPVTSEDDLHSDDRSGLQDILSSQKASAILCVNSTWRAAYTNLASLTDKSPDTWNILSTGIRLAKTKPLMIPGWIEDKRSSSLLADAWVGAQETFGALWKTTGVTFCPQVKTMDTEEKATPKVPSPLLSTLPEPRKPLPPESWPSRSTLQIVSCTLPYILPCKVLKVFQPPKKNSSRLYMPFGKPFCLSNPTRPTFFPGWNQSTEGAEITLPATG